ncbi:alpha-E domain-containing protein [Burkholderia cepacia]|uniref:alpha-E domain-containing protein n=2 Tax=Burkholderia cepacia TaxID=292 RepID=UPI001CF50100|nr:alpha-E domain-containing protein [Burkholderia cepacia]MCA8327613.1 alpha-E domain-containing protein [Burkholderia cepacia]
MLLGRTASGLYWMYRYIERAENIARIVDAGLRMALTRTSDAPAEWSSVLVSSGADDGYRQKYDAYAADTVTDYLLRDRDNPSSVLSCIEAARSNARMVRTALTREAWESVNGAWLALRRALAQPVPESELPAVLDEVKRETALILGSFYSTMLRNEIFDFAQIGAFIERADNTARIIDVKYHLLLPSVSQVGTILDTNHWESILRSVEAHNSYRWVYGVKYKPMNIADYLLLNGRMPRSLRHCYGRVMSSLNLLVKEHGTAHACHDTAAQTLTMLSDSTIERIFKNGLHEFLTGFIRRNQQLGLDIAQAYNFD